MISSIAMTNKIELVLREVLFSQLSLTQCIKTLIIKASKSYESILLLY